MKRLFTFDDFMVALIVALGYGLGAEIPKLLGWHPWLCVGLSMVAGNVLDMLVKKLVFCENVQRKKSYSVMIFAALILVFLAIQCFLVFWLNVSLLKYLVEEYQFALILPVLGLAASRELGYGNVPITEPSTDAPTRATSRRPACSP